MCSGPAPLPELPVKVLNHVFNEWMNKYWLETAAKTFKKYIQLLHNEIELYDLNQVIFLLKKSFDLNRDLNQWFKSPWFKSANPAEFREILLPRSLRKRLTRHLVQKMQGDVTHTKKDDMFGRQRKKQILMQWNQLPVNTNVVFMGMFKTDVTVMPIS